jgi:hypothetical protein
MFNQTELTNQELVQLLDKYLYGWEYKQIESASVQGSAKLAGFILGACFIDAMAGFLFGIDRDSAKKDSGKRFQDFVKKYMDQYDPEKLWQDLRCGLVHSYAAGETYAFTDNNKAGFHFESTSRGTIILNLEDFCADLRKAYALFRKDILNEREIFLNAKRRFNSMGLMMEIPVDHL